MEVGNDGLINAASRSQVGVHRSTTNVIRPVPLAGSHPTASIVTLDSRRPRAQNEYVDSPPTEGQTLQSKKVSRPVRTKVEGNIQRTTVLPRQDRVSQEREADTHHVVFTSQPKPLVKPPTIGSVEADLSHEDDSIICKHCGKCRCDRCKEMQKLPSYWLCNKKCHLSADSALKACTCLCAVECCFYHYAKDYQMDADVMCTDYPCACCSRPHCCKRWLCMAAMSVCLPCLCCYWPAKCGIKLCTACYNRCTNKGCQCTRSERGSQNKRLLESDSSSA